MFILTIPVLLKLPAALPPADNVPDEGVADGRGRHHGQRERLVLRHDAFQQLQRRLRHLRRGRVHEDVVERCGELGAVGEEPPLEGSLVKFGELNQIVANLSIIQQQIDQI